MDAAFYSALVAIFLIAISPGPSVIAIMATGVNDGRKPALALVGGIITGSSIWALVSLFSIAGLLQTVGWALTAIKILGGVYLLYLAYRAFIAARSDRTKPILPVSKSNGLKGYYLTGLLIHLTNPKAVFGWASTIAIGLPANASFYDVLTLVLCSIAIVWTVKTSMAFIFSAAPARSIYQRLRRSIQYTFATLFALVGARLLFSR